MTQSVAAKILLLDRDNRILLLRRSVTHPRYALKWDIPGGFVEDNEDIKDTIVRELIEEASIKVNKNTFSLVYAKTDFYEKGTSDDEPRSVVRVFYKCTVAEKQPHVVVSWEHDQFAWVTLPEATNMLEDTVFFDCITYITKNHIVTS